MSFDTSGEIAVEEFPHEAIRRNEIFAEIQRLTRKLQTTEAEISEIINEKVAIRSEVDYQYAATAMGHVFDWIRQRGMDNLEGERIRLHIGYWVFLEEFQPLTMSQLAAVMGKDKQSVGRWFDDLKREFPDLKTDHMKL